MTACSSDNQNPLMIKDTNANTDILDEDDIKFDIEQIILSKGFQSLDPKVDIVKKDNGFRLLTSLGLLETSGVKITNINKSGNEINIHVENIFNRFENQLAIPQVMIELKDVRLRSIENAKFNIINENYKPIKVKSPNDIISKVNSDFQIVTNTSPDINIINNDDSLLWVLNYKNILDKYNLETPIVNMTVIVDANSGELIKSSKNFISQIIDEGNILDYIPNEFLLYKKQEKIISKDGKWTNLWAYDVNSEAKRILYSTNLEIIDAKYSPNYDSIVILESNDINNQLYIMSKDDSKAYKVVFDTPINPSIVKWKDNSNLYILGKTGVTSTIYNYNIIDNTKEIVNYMYSDIVGFQIQNDDVIITVKDKDSGQYYIKLTSDWTNYDIQNEGYMPRFINNNYIGYIEFNEKNNTNELVLLNREQAKVYDKINLNVTNYFIIDEGTIGIISSNQINNDFTFHKYELDNKKLEPIVNISSDRAYYNNENDLLYIDFKVSFESTKSQIIYSLNLSKINTTEPLVK